MIQDQTSQLIASVSDRLTKTELRIAQAVLDEPTLLAFGTVSDLAERVGTSRPSIVRFATKLGFEGYTELQDRHSGMAGLIVAARPEIAEFLRTRARYPFFYKPILSHKSQGAGLVRSFDAASDTLRTIERDDLPVEELAREIVRFSRFRNLDGALLPTDGYLFQEVVEQHPALSELVGETLASFKVTVGIDDRGPRIWAVTWKIPASSFESGAFFGKKDRRPPKLATCAARGRPPS